MLAVINNQLVNFSKHEHIKSLFRSNSDLLNPSKFDLHPVLQHAKFIDSAAKSNILLIKEALNIKQKKKLFLIIALSTGRIAAT